MTHLRFESEPFTHGRRLALHLCHHFAVILGILLVSLGTPRTSIVEHAALRRLSTHWTDNVKFLTEAAVANVLLSTPTGLLTATGIDRVCKRNTDIGPSTVLSAGAVHTPQHLMLPSLLLHYRSISGHLMN
ncbi:hypothetical protein BKA67DRAFT_182921 [Truncatella angustata]|uniref:Uncharacterized protein n=1 Tax=Truncatella angustata TaxID=152316 RepID=A0A9P9A0L6_9PEZI|nr:uncharacterized protein BKA67DRAFT_182921 [Truncatella angustata]KAH6657214.1 hypothetical protein BKA67DRAFT_182921 [Truncatella angustata]